MNDTGTLLNILGNWGKSPQQVNEQGNQWADAVGEVFTFVTNVIPWQSFWFGNQSGTIGFGTPPAQRTNNLMIYAVIALALVQIFKK